MTISCQMVSFENQIIESVEKIISAAKLFESTISMYSGSASTGPCNSSAFLAFPLNSLIRSKVFFNRFELYNLATSDRDRAASLKERSNSNLLMKNEALGKKFHITYLVS